MLATLGVLLYIAAIGFLYYEAAKNG